MSDPVRVHDHPVLGTLTFNSGLNWWETQSTLPLGDTAQVAFSLSVNDDPDVPAERFDAAADIVRRLDPSSLRHLVAEHYLELYNDTWCQDDVDLDHDGFCARIRPTSINFRVDLDEGGNVEVYFDDGDLFLGHSILLMLDAELQLVDIKLVG